MKDFVKKIFIKFRGFFVNIRKRLEEFRAQPKRVIIWAVVSVFLVPFLYMAISEYIKLRPVLTIFRYFFERLPQMLIGYIPLVLLFGLITLMTRRPWIPALIIGVINVLLSYANYYKMLYLDTPILAADFSLIGEAAIITEQYKAPFYLHAWAGVLMTLFIVFALIPIRLPKFKVTIKELLYRVTSCLAVATLFVVFFSGVIYTREGRDAFKYESIPFRIEYEYEVNTFYSGLFANTKTLFTGKADGYSAEAVDEIAAELAAIGTVGQKKPDVIVVLVESWEFMEEYEDVTFSQNLHPNYDRLKEESITGTMLSSSTRGKGTANVEFEVLTGLSKDDDILPLTAYNSYVYDGMPCYPGFLAEHGYTNYAIHPFHYELYNRPNVYAAFGFDHLYSENDFVNPKRFGPFISDEEAVNKTIEVYESAVQENDRVFIQLITMQNHGPIGPDTLPAHQRTVKLDDPGSFSGDEIDILENAATLMLKTDEAIGDLVDYFRESERDVIIVVYGDHQFILSPLEDAEAGLPEMLARTDFYKNNSEYDAAIKTHSTPYLMWSNYQLPSVDSHGYLAPSIMLPIALAEFDVIRPAYFQWLLNESASSEVKARSANFVIRSDGTVEYPVRSISVEYLSRRNILTYQIVYKKNEVLSNYIY